VFVQKLLGSQSGWRRHAEFAAWIREPAGGATLLLIDWFENPPCIGDADIESIVNLPQGQIFHDELAPDQLFFKRSVPHYADYRTPLAGLYQCGSSCHPGGGVSGIPGHNAAREILRDRGKKLSR
jgi:phytoene dehydrogenase-like protein